MKSEKRHELQKNELADWLGNRVETYGDYFWPVVGGVVFAFAVAVGIAWYMGSQDAKSATAWNSFYMAYGEADREAELEKVGEVDAGSPAALWALQGAGDIALSKGSNLMFTDRAEAGTHLKQAKDNYQAVLDRARDPLLLSRAQYGMAKLLETECQPAEALKYYEMVAKSEKDKALGKAAERDAKRMADPQVVSFLDWFAKQNPKRPSPLGHGGMPGMGPLSVPTDLPDRPNLSLPSLDLDGPSLDPGKLPADSSKLEFPKPGESTPAEAPKTESPPAEPPAAEAPKTEAPKADEPKTDAPKPEAPKTEAPPADAPAAKPESK